MSADNYDDFISLITDDGFSLPDNYLDIELSQERLLLENSRFMNDIKLIRDKYGIQIKDQGDYSESAFMSHLSSPPDIANSKHFVDDVDLISRKIKLPGDWSGVVKDFIFGIDNIGLGTSEYPSKNAIARKVKSSKGNYVEVRLYGDLTVPELREIIKSDGKLRELIKESNSIKKPYSTSNAIGFRVNKMRSKGLTYQQIWEQLKIEGQTFEDYHYVHKIHKRFNKKVDSLYA